MTPIMRSIEKFFTAISECASASYNKLISVEINEPSLAQQNLENLFDLSVQFTHLLHQFPKNQAGEMPFKN